MKISELKDNWERVSSATMTKYPFVVCVLQNRDIEVNGSDVILRYNPDEEIFKKIAQKYIGVIYEGIKSYVDDEFTLKIEMEE